MSKRWFEQGGAWLEERKVPGGATVHIVILPEGEVLARSLVDGAALVQMYADSGIEAFSGRDVKPLGSCERICGEMAETIH